MTVSTRRTALIAAFVTLAAGAASAQGFGLLPSAPSSPPVAALGVTALAPKVTLSITALRRHPDKGVLQLEFAVANGSDLAVSLRELGLGDWNRLEGVQLVDFVNKRRYAMGRSDGMILSSQFANADGGRIKPAETKSFWAWFAMPPSEVQQMAVLVPDRSPILDVQVQ